MSDTTRTRVSRMVMACRDDSSVWVEVAGSNRWELAPRNARELAGYLIRAADVADSYRTDSATDRSQTSAPHLGREDTA